MPSARVSADLQEALLLLESTAFLTDDVDAIAYRCAVKDVESVPDAHETD